MYPACIIKKNLLIFDLSYIQGPAFQEGNTQDDNKKRTTQLDVLKMLPMEH